MSNSDNIANWITAISTAATTVVVGIGTVLAILKSYKDKGPIVESDMHWIKPHERTKLEDGSRCVVLNILIRNQLRETITLNRAQIKKPRRSQISWEGIRDSGGGIGSIRKNESDRTWINQNVGAIYSTSSYGAADIVHIDFYLSPPDDWDGGWIIVDLWFSSKAFTMRNKRKRVKNMMTPNPFKHTAVKARSHGI